MKKIIKVTNLTKIYKDGNDKVIALDNVSFSLGHAEDLAIVGPSGSGKTTLLELMAGLNRPTSGKVTIDGKDINKLSDNQVSQLRNKKIGFVFQMMHLQDYFTALENVTIPLIACSKDRKKSLKKAKELLTMVGLAHRMQHHPKQLSGGEMQRVAIARALANDPKIVMADEPTGTLDKENAHKVLDMLFDISKKRGVSVIMVTHDISIAEKFKNKMELKHGKVENN